MQSIATLTSGGVKVGVPFLSFRVFGFAAGPLALPPRVVLFGNWLLVQSFCSAEVAPLWVRRSRFAVGRFLGCVVFLQRTSPVTVKRSVESSLRVPPSSRVLPSKS